MSHVEDLENESYVTCKGRDVSSATESEKCLMKPVKKMTCIPLVQRTGCQTACHKLSSYISPW